MKILMVHTSHDQPGNTGRKTGFWLEEGAAPYFVFRDAGVQLTLTSPKGGQPPVDPKSADNWTLVSSILSYWSAPVQFSEDDYGPTGVTEPGKLTL